MVMKPIMPWNFPGSHVEIRDNTEWEIPRETQVDGVRLFQTIFSERGRSNKIVFKRDVNDFLEEFGNMDFAKYGQSSYNAHAHLEQNLTSAYILRLTADDATYANNVILANVKLTPYTPADDLQGTPAVPGEMKVKFTSVSLPALTDVTEINARLQEILEDGEVDTGDGYVIPLLCSYVTGPGTYGNSFRSRIVRDSMENLQTEQNNYAFEMLEMKQSLSRVRSYIGSMYAMGRYRGESTFINDIIEQAEIDELNENRSVVMTTNVFEEGFDRLYTMYRDQVKPMSLVPESEFDPLFGLDLDKKEIEGYVVELPSDDEDSVNFSAPDGIALSSGSDGALDTSDMSAAARQERERVQTDLLLRAFKGEIDRNIASTRRVLTEFMLDAGYPDVVKDAMRQLQGKRNSECMYLDAGPLSSITDALEYAQKTYDQGTYGVSDNAYGYDIRDPFTGKRVPVTATHHIASELATFFNDDEVGGNYRAFAASTAPITKHLPNSVFPAFDKSLDPEAMEYLYERRVNYVEFMSQNRYQRATQSTSKVGSNPKNLRLWSDLNEENNVHVLYEAKKVLEGLSDEQNYKHKTPEDRDLFRKAGQLRLERYIGHKAHSFAIEYDTDPRNKELLICRVGIVFKPMNKRQWIGIDINPYVEGGN